MLSQLFTWWNKTTLGTSFTLWRRSAREVGKDAYDNRYFEEESASASDGRVRRWVIYNGVAEASRVPSDWHGWLHHTYDDPPTEKPLVRHVWEKDHLPNMTGTPLAYHPKGSLSRRDSQIEPEYDAWTPGESAS